MTEFSTGFATEHDKDALVDLQAAVGGGFATPEDFEHWYLGHPFGPVTIPVVRAPDGSLAGAAWIFPMRVSIEGRDAEFARGANLHVRPEYQHGFAYTTLSRHLGRELAKQAPLHVSLVSSRTYQRQREVQPELVTPVPWLIRVLDPRAWARRYSRSGWRRRAEPWVRMVARISFSPRDQVDTGKIRVDTTDTFDERFDAFWASVRTSHPIIPVGNGDYLRWRFGGQRLRSYVVFVAESASEMLGYGVLRVMREDEAVVAYVVDFVLGGGGQGDLAGAALLGNIEAYCRDLGVIVVSTSLPPSSREWSVLLGAGFRENPLERAGRMQGIWPPPLRAALFVHDNTALPPMAWRAREWYLTLGLHETL